MKPSPRFLACVPRETVDRLTIYVDLLRRWNQTVNLVSRRDEMSLWGRHVEDSFDLAAAIPSDFEGAIDIGSGAGFPGLILAIATNRPFELIESDQRKAAFLREAARATSATVTVHATRIELANLSPVKLITARALAPLDVLLGYAFPLLSAGGICLFPKGRSASLELSQACTKWKMRVDRLPSKTDPEASILRISEVSRVSRSD